MSGGMMDIPRDRRILVWLMDYPADCGPESGWFTAEYDGDGGWRIGLHEIEGCTWIEERHIRAWSKLPPDPKVAAS